METLEQKVRRICKENHMTQSKLAESVVVDFTYISKIENDKGLRPPAESTLGRIALFLQTDAEELILMHG